MQDYEDDGISGGNLMLAIVLFGGMFAIVAMVVFSYAIVKDRTNELVYVQVVNMGFDKRGNFIAINDSLGNIARIPVEAPCKNYSTLNSGDMFQLSRTRVFYLDYTVKYEWPMAANQLCNMKKV